MDVRMALLKLMSIPTSQYMDVIKTSDGYYLGMAYDDIGFSHFLGNPSPPHDGPGRDYMLATWNGLSDSDRARVYGLAKAKGINLEHEFGVPVWQMMEV